MELSKERVNEIAYALLLATLSKQDLQLDPDQLKRKLGNMPQRLQHLPEQFRNITPEDLQAAARIICHDLVDYAFAFTFKKKKARNK